MKEPTKSEFPLGGLNLESLMDAVIYRDEFLSIAGHELKTPLTSLKLQTQVFKRSIQKKRSDAYDKDKVDRLVDQIERHTGHMSKLIEQMLDVCKLRAGRFTLTEQSFDLSHALRSYLKCHELTITKSNRESPSKEMKTDFFKLWAIFWTMPESMEKTGESSSA